MLVPVPSCYPSTGPSSIPLSPCWSHPTPVIPVLVPVLSCYPSAGTGPSPVPLSQYWSRSCPIIAVLVPVPLSRSQSRYPGTGPGPVALSRYWSRSRYPGPSPVIPVLVAVLSRCPGPGPSPARCPRPLVPVSTPTRPGAELGSARPGRDEPRERLGPPGNAWDPSPGHSPPPGPPGSGRFSGGCLPRGGVGGGGSTPCPRVTQGRPVLRGHPRIGDTPRVTDTPWHRGGSPAPAVRGGGSRGVRPLPGPSARPRPARSLPRMRLTPRPSEHVTARSAARSARRQGAPPLRPTACLPLRWEAASPLPAPFP
ncbi:uncharacterized protein ACIBXB_018599 [Morphnus guianensis]